MTILQNVHVPFVSERVKLSIELPHCDGLGVEDERVNKFERHTSWGTFALEGGEGISKHLVALGLAGDGRTNQHETVAHDCGLVQLNALLHKT